MKRHGIVVAAAFPRADNASLQRESYFILISGVMQRDDSPSSFLLYIEEAQKRPSRSIEAISSSVNLLFAVIIILSSLRREPRLLIFDLRPREH